jgi:hypothetical protein
VATDIHLDQTSHLLLNLVNFHFPFQIYFNCVIVIVHRSNYFSLCESLSICALFYLSIFFTKARKPILDNIYLVFYLLLLFDGIWTIFIGHFLQNTGLQYTVFFKMFDGIRVLKDFFPEFKTFK